MTLETLKTPAELIEHNREDLAGFKDHLQSQCDNQTTTLALASTFVGLAVKAMRSHDLLCKLDDVSDEKINESKVNLAAVQVGCSVIQSWLAEKHIALETENNPPYESMELV